MIAVRALAMRYGVAPDHFDDWTTVNVNRELAIAEAIDERHQSPLTDFALRMIISEIMEAFAKGSRG